VERPSYNEIKRCLDDVYAWALDAARRPKNAAKPHHKDEKLSFLARKLVEEAGEVAEAIIEQDYEQARNEIGDVVWTAAMLLSKLGEFP
jgi:NTP pyrophosphatase (non-canonical NTP hydrolase)